MNWNTLIFKCIDNVSIPRKELVEVCIAGCESIPGKDYPWPELLQYPNHSTLKPKRGIVLSGGGFFIDQTALKTIGKNVWETRWKPTLSHDSYPVSPSRSFFFLSYLFYLCLKTNMILTGMIRHTVFTFSLISSLLFNFIFPLLKNSVACFVWSLCHVLHYIWEYLSSFSILLMLKF